MTTTRALTIGLAASICFLSGCAKNNASDQDLASSIQAKLASDDTTKASNIKVDAKSGVVTLSGDVPSSDVELEAMKVANGTSGVARVDDQLKVNAAAAATAPGYPTTSAATTSAPANTPAPAAATPPPAATPAPAPAPAPAVADNTPPPPPKPTTFTVPVGSRLSVRTIDPIDSRKNSVGQTFNATLDSPLTVGDRVVVAAGSPVTITLTSARNAGRIKGSSELAVRVTSLTDKGRAYNVDSDVYEDASKGKGKQTAIRSGIGAAAGALIGGLAGGGKGAAIGAGAGGGAGLGYQFFTHGTTVKIPSETVLTFRLASPLTVRR